MKYLYILTFIVVYFTLSCTNIEVNTTRPVNMDVYATYYSDTDIMEVATCIYGTTDKDILIHLDETHKQLLYNVTIYDNRGIIILDKMQPEKYDRKELLIEAPISMKSGEYLITDRVQNINDITKAFIFSIGDKRVVPSTVRVRIDLNYSIKGGISNNRERLSVQDNVKIRK